MYINVPEGFCFPLEKEGGAWCNISSQDTCYWSFLIASTTNNDLGVKCAEHWLIGEIIGFLLCIGFI